MTQDDILHRALRRAYVLLNVRPRSEKELRDRLKQKGYGDSVVTQVLDDLKRVGAVDDAKFAKFWIESRMHLNPVGAVVLRHELASKGIVESVVEDALVSSGCSAESEYEIARTMAVGRIERLRRIDKRKAAKRLFDFLARRGFDYGVIHKILDELL
ncbi:MAG: regulatory protein RecX [Candidatus Omnitrophota bacterium]